MGVGTHEAEKKGPFFCHSTRQAVSALRQRQHRNHWDVNLGPLSGACAATLDNSFGALVFRALDFLWPAEAPSRKGQAVSQPPTGTIKLRSFSHWLKSPLRVGLEMTGPQS